MAEQKLTITDFSGGTATTSEKKDIPNAARFVKGMNPYEDPTYLTLSRLATKKSSTTVAGLPYWMVDGSPWATDRYVYDSAGKVYGVDNADSFSLLRTVSGGAGEGLLVFDDYLYYALGVSLGRYGLLSGTPAFNDDFLTDGTTNVDQSGGGTGSADYVPPTSISEAATARQTFTPTVDPIKAIIIDVDVVGSGDWTVTLHDSNNVSLGTSTIVNGSMSTGDVTFTLSSPGRVITGNEHHFHVVSTVADGGVDTNAATDLEGAEFSTLFGILIDVDFHPIVSHLNLIVIGNESYLAAWDQAVYSANKVILPRGFEVRALAKTDEYVVAEAFKGSTIREAEAAKRFYWDGISPTYNFSTDITVGACNAIGTVQNQLLGVYGHRGTVYRSNAQAELEDIYAKVPKLARGKYVEVYPGAMAEYEGNALIGYTGATDDTSSFEMGVYEFGSQDSKLPKVLNMSYLVSTGTTQDSNLKISMVKVFGKDIYVGWQDGATTYGVDKIALGDSALASGSWESLIFDGGNPKREELAVSVKITFEALETGESVTPKYRINRASSFTTGTAASTVGDTEVTQYINSRFKEIEFGFNVASSSNTFLKITSIVFTFDDLSSEKVD